MERRVTRRRLLFRALLGLAGLYCLGLLLPVGYSVQRTVSVSRPPHVIWQMLMDVDGLPTWRRGLTRTERLPDQHGLPAWREYRGGDSLTVMVTEAQPPSRLVTATSSGRKPVEGSWVYDIATSPEGSTLTITEHGETDRPVLRLLAWTVLGHGRGIDRYVKDLAARLAVEKDRETALRD